MEPFHNKVEKVVAFPLQSYPNHQNLTILIWIISSYKRVIILHP